MKLHKQTILHSEESNGNCWATCLACLLDSDDIPFIEHNASTWWEESEKFANKHGKTLVEFPWQGGRFNRIPCIISGDSPRGAFKHSVIGECKSDEEKSTVLFVHDPHPDNSFIKSVDWITIAIPLP